MQRAKYFFLLYLLHSLQPSKLACILRCQQATTILKSYLLLVLPTNPLSPNIPSVRSFCSFELYTVKSAPNSVCLKDNTTADKFNFLTLVLKKTGTTGRKVIPGSHQYWCFLFLLRGQFFALIKVIP